MYERREAALRDVDLTNGPGKLTQAFDVGKELHNETITQRPLYVTASDAAHEWPIRTSSRIGITRGIELPWRFFIPGNPYVSPGTPSDLAAARRRLRNRL
jgi:DNA-3-methyladenine glycosylase